MTFSVRENWIQILALTQLYELRRLIGSIFFSFMTSISIEIFFQLMYCICFQLLLIYFNKTHAKSKSVSIFFKIFHTSHYTWRALKPLPLHMSPNMTEFLHLPSLTSFYSLSFHHRHVANTGFHWIFPCSWSLCRLFFLSDDISHWHALLSDLSYCKHYHFEKDILDLFRLLRKSFIEGQGSCSVAQREPLLGP